MNSTWVRWISGPRGAGFWHPVPTGNIRTSGDAGGAARGWLSGSRSDEEDSVTTISTSVNIGKKPAPVTLSDTATTKVAELLAQEEGDNLALRVAVKPGGCSGYSYEMFFDTEVMTDDVVREFGAVRVVVDAASAELLSGSTLDYSDGLQGAGFHISNPNATRTCGCGSSFS
jgi:iron-sulfur cluster assembly protein/iron-sulfur cluster insertion protein